MSPICKKTNILKALSHGASATLSKIRFPTDTWNPLKRLEWSGGPADCKVIAKRSQLIL